MSDFIGPVPVPAPPSIGAFPLMPDYGSGMDLDPSIIVHLFDQPGLKTEQRFIMGDGARRFRVRKARLACSEYDSLKAHWEQAEGVYAQFLYTYPGNISQAIICRYENPSITFPHLVGMITGDPGLTLLEVPQTFPTFSSDYVLDRFPNDVMKFGLAQQTQRIIPLVDIFPKDGSAPIHLSNQRLLLDGVSYLPRLLDWQGISQSLGETSDSAQFTLGNADGVFQKLVNQISLYRAGIQFSLYHVAARSRLNLWTGYARPWNFDADGKFILGAADGLYELTLSYPSRQVARTCWKDYKGLFCPSVSSLPDCPKSWEACQERGVPLSFGGMVVPAQSVRVKDNSTGTFGWGRSVFTSVTVTEDTVYQRPVQEIYTDTALLVVCDVASGRDEGDFYSAIGIVGEGPINRYSINLVQHTLDGSPPHDPKQQGGWRGVVGNDPAGPRDFFGIDQFPWTTVPADATYAAGLAFAEIRRSDQEGLQLINVRDREMKVMVIGGLGGWTWTAAGNRVWTPTLSNLIWVLVNVYLRGIGLKVVPANASLVPAAVMERYFNVQQAIDAAAICDLSVAKLVGTGFEKQFPFRGCLKEKKPLKDWMQEICNSGLGYFTFANGKLWPGVRINSSVLAGNAFRRESILYKSLQVAPQDPKFNYLTVQFGDEEFDFQLNNVTVYDIDHAKFVGSNQSPQYIPSSMSLAGVSNKSQASRIALTRLKEEVGGATLDEQLAARSFRFLTTVLALQTQVGDIISLDHDELPNGRVEGRVQQWTLNPDLSIELVASPSTDSMYSTDEGPKPPDVPAEPPLPELLPSPAGLAWLPNEIGPFEGDPLYPVLSERTFDLWQDYKITREGVWEPAIWVRGEFPVNLFVAQVQVRILGVSLAGGGQLAGGQTVYVAITMTDAAGGESVPSNLTAVWIDPALSGQQLTLTLSLPPAGAWSGYSIWAGTDRRRIALQTTVAGALPLSYSFTGPVLQMTMGMPATAARKVRVAAKHVWHSGVAGVLISGVPANNQIQCNDAIGSTDNWDGRILSALADQSDGSAPLWNFTVTAFDGASGTFTVTPDCVRANSADSVEAGDVLIVRSTAVGAGADYVTDPLWNNFISRNQSGSPGLRNDEEVGRVARILFGKGAGQFRHINTNFDDTIHVNPDWEVIPDATSIIIVEAADYVYFAESSALRVAHSGSKVEIRLRVDNLRNEVALVGGFLEDDQGRFTDESFAVFREIFVYGQPPTVRIVGPDPGPWDAQADDHTLRADTSLNDVVIQLPPLSVYQGRALLVFNDGPNIAKIFAWPGETFFDGSAEIELANLGDSVRITAG